MANQVASFNTKIVELSLMQSQWASVINPVLAKPLNSGIILSEVPLAIGVNVINHKLGRKLQGWILTDTNGVAKVYRSAPKDALTLTLTSDAAIVADLLVF